MLAKPEEATHAGNFDQEFRILRQDGALRWVWVKAFSVHDSVRIVRWLVGTVQDVTTRKYAEAQIAGHLQAAEGARAEAEALRKSTLWQRLREHFHVCASHWPSGDKSNAERQRFPGVIPRTFFGFEPHHELALKAARETLVLLKNKDNLLPVGTRYKNIAVIGPNADSVNSLVGNYNGTPSHPVTVLAGVRKRFGASTVVYAEGSSLTGFPLTPVPAKFLKSDSGTEGFSAEYFQGRDRQGAPVIKRTDNDVNFVWQDGADPQLKSNFSVRWTSNLVPPTTGDYDIGFSGTDTFRVWLDDQLVGLASYANPGRSASKTVHLEAGHSYPVKIEYSLEGSAGYAKFVWHEPGTQKDYPEIIRKTDLIIAVLGLTSGLEGEEMPIHVAGFVGGDRTSLDLPQAQEGSFPPETKEWSKLDLSY